MASAPDEKPFGAKVRPILGLSTTHCAYLDECGEMALWVVRDEAYDEGAYYACDKHLSDACYLVMADEEEDDDE